VLQKTFALLVLILSSGCSLLGSKPDQVTPVEVKMIEVKQPTYHPPLPAPVEFKKIEWKVWTPDLMKTYVADLESGEAPSLIQYALTVQGYEALSYSIADVRRYIVQLQSVVKYYRSLDKEEKEEPEK